ncbi:hypothetical protein RCL_jg8215.t2 [Rhizophagus clarus]|uniref:Uncharacterized protein n=1 Tax=Rhizophagus clarus TaxID=94130 RepID=A0A8H3MHN5_9GLOM|nr:hypothetical protein RCL_jg8215.t2 [Rhizophagus clarus]
MSSNESLPLFGSIRWSDEAFINVSIFIRFSRISINVDFSLLQRSWSFWTYISFNGCFYASGSQIALQILGGSWIGLV